jgi:hypothetical protein
MIFSVYHYSITNEACSTIQYIEENKLYVLFIIANLKEYLVLINLKIALNVIPVIKRIIKRCNG